MWNSIATEITKATHSKFNITHTKEVSGGDINSAFIIAGSSSDPDTKQYFVKINQKHNIDIFLSECISLDHLAITNQIIIPKVITCGTTLDKSYLVLEYLEMHTAATNTDNVGKVQWYALGAALANLHSSHQQAEFGWPEDNYIGSTIQTNAWQKNWSMFFSEQRIGLQLQLLKDKGIYLGDINNIVDLCHQRLMSHHPIPSLVHGDLWQGNVAFVNNLPCIYDPACYYGDREVDIAMSELFGRFPDSFYEGYNHTYPLKNGYQQRKSIYNAYHILNHANLFAGIYIDQALSFINELQKNG